MAPALDDVFNQDRNNSFALIIDLIAEKQAAYPATFIQNFNSLAPEAVRDGAMREAYGLISGGIAHLKDGAPGKKPGAMTAAFSKASIRSSALAASLGIKPPQFEPILLPADYSTGREAAIYTARRLIEAAEGDLGKSRQILQQKIQSGDLSRAFGHMTDGVHPDLQKIIDNLPEHIKAPAPLPVPSAELLDFKKQVIMSCNMLVESYAAACADIRHCLNGLPPPKPQDRPTHFHL